MLVVPLPREGWSEEHQLHVVFHQAQKPSKKGGDFIRATKHLFRKFWIPRDICWLFKWIEHRFTGIQTEAS